MVAKVLTQNGFVRHIPLQRELVPLFNVPGWGTVPSLMCGIPMVGHAVWVPEMMSRNKPASCSTQQVVDKHKQNNFNMIGQTTLTGDITAHEKHGRTHEMKLTRVAPCLCKIGTDYLKC